MKRLSVRVMTIVPAMLWGGCMLVVGLINLAAPSYGLDFLRLMSSVYPGLHPTHTVGELILGTIYGLADGAIAGCLFALLYNWFAGMGAHSMQDAHQ